MRTRALAAAGALAVTASLTLAAPADAATNPAIIQAKQRPATIHGNGQVTAVMWIRCAPDLVGTGYQATMFQNGIPATTILVGGPGTITCDGTRHRYTLELDPSGGDFTRGYADLFVNASIANPDGSFRDVSDTARVWLRL